MAQVANTFETYDAVGNREELADKIYQITPEETPFVSLIGRRSVASVHPEWQLDTLEDPDTTNAQPEGNDWSFDATDPTSRVGNYTQISTKSWTISRTQEETSKAGRKSELAYQTAKKGVALRIDQEVICLGNQASSAGSGDAASNRTLGAFRAWLATNDNMGSTGASGGFNTSTKIVDAATNGTQRAFTKTIMDAVILSTYNAGGSPKTLMVSPYVKTVFTGFMDAAGTVNLRHPVTGNGGVTIIAAADMYQSDFGLISVVPNRQMARAGAGVARNALLIDPRMAALGVFHDISLEKPAQTGDGQKRVLVTEYTLLVDNEAAHGVAADLFGMSSAS